MSNPIVIKKAFPNKFPIRIVQYDSDELYYVQETDPEGYWEDDGYEATCKEDAETYFAKRCKELQNTPNQAAQDAYDDEHGTINGYAPFQYNREY